MFFAPSTFLPNAATKAVYLNDAGKLEVKELCGLRKCRKQIEVKVWWRGFNKESDKTWEPVVTIAEDLPDVVIEYLRSQTSLLAKETLLMLSRLFDLGASATTSVVGVCSVGVNYDLITVPADDEVAFKVGWSKAEKELLRQCVKKYALGSFQEYARHLPSMNRQQLYGMLQKLCVKKSGEKLPRDAFGSRGSSQEEYGCIWLCVLCEKEV
eukprot:augustus_masked-scaffold_24-processed-gene-4.40-mRNA-1 protein AED:1.00 eAED:1.00 QI:0/-1/0/0/-1/1/1/0/210